MNIKELNLSVTQVCNYIKSIFDAEEMLIGIKIFGEITNYKKSGKAIYFDIKDENSAIPCIAFDDSIFSEIDFGNKVVITGRFNFYSKMGRLSFVVSKVESFGVGELYKKYIELKSKLEKEGLFDERYKKQIPQFPKRIGVVSSETGAVIRDIIKVARSKNLSSDIVLFPAKVQGVGSVQEIIRGIKFLDNYNVDLIIVARGGGSFEDYQPFNTEEMVRTVFEAQKPIISAIGHENDWTLIDFVADLRASTPSVASDMAFYDELGIFEKIKNNTKKQLESIISKITVVNEKFETVFNKNTLFIKHKFDTYLNKWHICNNNNFHLVNNIISNELQKCKIISTKIDQNNPMKMLIKGYTRIEKTGENVLSVNELSLNESVTLNLIDGNILAEVKEIKRRSRDEL